MFYKSSQRYLKETSPPVHNISGHSLKPILISHMFSIVFVSNTDKTFEMFSYISTKAGRHLCVGLTKPCCSKWQLIKTLSVFHLLFPAPLLNALSYAPPYPSLSAHTSSIGSYGAKTDSEAGRSFVSAPGGNISKEMCFSLRNLLKFFNLSWIQKRVLSFAGLLSSFQNNSSTEYSSSFHYHGAPEKPKAGKKIEHNGFEAKQLHILLLQHCPRFRC